MSENPQDLAEALRYHQSGDLETSERIYRRILQEDPHNAQALHLLGLVQLQLGRNHEAVEYLTSAVELDASNADYQNHQGVAYAALKQFDRALASFRKALQINPRLVDAHYNLGSALSRRNKPEEAIACYREAIRLRPNFAEAHYSLANKLRDRGELNEAIARYEQVLQIRPSHGKARENLVALLLRLGKRLCDQGRNAEAAARFRRVIELNPDSVEAHARLGSALAAGGKHAEAVGYFRRALSLRPAFPEALINMGVSLRAQGELDQAVASYREALKLRPDYAEAHCNLGVAYMEQCRYEEALASCTEAIRLSPEFSEARLNLAFVLERLGRYAEAVEIYRQVLRRRPEFVEGHYGLGTALSKLDRLDEALESFNEALRRDPQHAEAHLGRAFAWLRCGDFERGWPEFEWRVKTKRYPNRERPYPRWDCSPLPDRTILLAAEQGLGDTFQLIRYAALVKQRVGTVVVECQRPLLHILKSCPGIDRLIPHGDPLPAFDVYAPLNSLPGMFRSNLDTVPAEIPYLFADDQLVGRWRKILDQFDGLKIGLAWRGSPLYQIDGMRSFALEELEAIARIPRVCLISLQKVHGTEELEQLAGRFRVAELGPKFDEESGAFMDTAAVMMCLDLVICCDTAVGHLAGALGVPVWLALSFAAADWRWLQGRRDTPWYPRHRFFPQQRHGDWKAVFEEMRTALEEKL